MFWQQPALINLIRMTSVLSREDYRFLQLPPSARRRGCNADCNVPTRTVTVLFSSGTRTCGAVRLEKCHHVCLEVFCLVCVEPQFKCDVLCAASPLDRALCTEGKMIQFRKDSNAQDPTLVSAYEGASKVLFSDAKLVL